jgi:hypothetical protein
VTGFITYVTDFITNVTAEENRMARFAEEGLQFAGLVSGWFTGFPEIILGAEAAEAGFLCKVLCIQSIDRIWNRFLAGKNSLFF